MFRSRFSRSPDRRGVILLVVLTLLALFAVIGLSFALYAEQEATAARIHRESYDVDSIDFDTQAREFAHIALGQIIYDVDDVQPTGEQKAFSGFRGHSLARSMYGYNSTNRLMDNLSPYSGMGRITTGAPIDGAQVSDIVNFSLKPDGTLVVDPEYGMSRASMATAPTATNYQNVASPYTYPDLKDYYLAAQDPVTGQIKQPSFFRDWARFGTLAQSNMNWTNAEGRLYTVRPRPFDHEFNSTQEFPFPTPNADGTYTGDVQNLPNPQGIQHNDSIWIYPGGRVFTHRGRQFTACIAPLILDLSGRVPLSLAGNLKGGTASVSNSGIGPWEINLTKIFDLAPGTVTSYTALQQLINGNSPYDLAVAGRHGVAATNPPVDRITQYMHTQFNGPTMAKPMGKIPPHYSPVDYDAIGTSKMSPIGTGTSPFPSFPADRYFNDAATQMTELNNHPAQYRPDYWKPTDGSATQGRSFTVAELQWLYGEYGDTFKQYAKNDVTKLAPNHVGATDYTAQPQVVNDKANLVRMLTTTHNSDLSRPEVLIPASATTSTTAAVRLGPIDLNRTLKEYANGNTYNYDNVNTDPAVYATAVRDRQEFARDIFSRLVATYSIYAAPPATPTPLLNGTLVQYDDTNLYPKVLNASANETMRSLAQIAVNIVDYIDSDDVNTIFVWNPYNGSTYFNPLNALPATATPDQNIVVGVEQPRLVINEAYASLENNRNDTAAPAAEPLETRFWLELFNPLNQDTNLSEQGAARLSYQPMISPGTTMLANQYSPYQVEIIETSAAATQPDAEIRNPGNVLGTVSTTPAIRIGTFGQQDYTFDSNEAMKANATIADTMTGIVTDEAYLVHPANGAAMGTAGLNQGYFVLGPRDDHPAMGVNATLRLPDPPAMPPPAPPYASMSIKDTGNSMPKIAQVDALKMKRYTAVLRRLANPYILPQPDSSMANYNPYITVDYLAGIEPKDRVKVLDMDRMGFMPNTDPSIGSIHPFSSIASQVEAQTGGASPDHTFFKFNSSASSAAVMNLKWLVHKDRNLLNTLELLSVSAFGPAQLTNHFNVDSTFTQNYNAHTAEQIFVPGLQNGLGAFQAYDPMAMPSPTYGLGSMTPIFTQAGQMFKALDLLQVAPHQSGMAVGGRTHGKININMVGHRAVLEALLDANPNANYFQQTDVQNMWSDMNPAGTPERSFPQPSTAGNFDQQGDPMLGLIGGGTGTPSTPTAQTILRNNTTTMSPNFYTPQASLAMSGDSSHPVGIVEPLAKMWNNTTTTSNNFLVIMTVGFFEVRNVDTATGRVYLGKEYYEEYPGDTRSKFISYVDRTNLAVDTTTTTEQFAKTPWFTKMTENAEVGATTIKVEANTVGTNPVVYVNGNQVELKANDQILIGMGRHDLNGNDGELVTMTAVSGASGIATLTVNATTRFHPAGSPVSNAMLGNPGPQPRFNPEEPMYRDTVTPFFTRVER